MHFRQIFIQAFHSRKHLLKVYFLVIITGILMIMLRKYLHFRAGYSFLLWNFILASISSMASSLMVEMVSIGSKRFFVIIAAFVWLLFLPNGLYMLTDYKYIWNDYSGHIYPNIACLSWFILPALFLSVISLNDISELLKKRFNQSKVTAIILGICLLSGFGVFIGSVLRFNSWDILLHPYELLREILRYFIHPVVDRDPWVVTLSYATIYFLLFKVLSAVSKVLQKPADRSIGR